MAVDPGVEDPVAASDDGLGIRTPGESRPGTEVVVVPREIRFSEEFVPQPQGQQEALMNPHESSTKKP